MRYRIRILDRAYRDLALLPRKEAGRIVNRIEKLVEDLRGDVTKLKPPLTGFRLRVGDYRVLFDVEGDELFVHRVRDRRDAYDR